MKDKPVSEKSEKRATSSKGEIDAVKNLIKKQATTIRSKWRKVVTGNEEKRIRDHLKETEGQPKYVKFFDKVGFTFGVLNVLVCQYFLLNVPEYFPTWYAIVLPTILLSRFYHFRSLNWQYFLIDFCYFTILATLINVYVLKSTLWLFKMCFIHATGTLPIAVIIWRNSLIFHDYDKIVSLYIHILPCMLYYTMRWCNPSFSQQFHCDSNISCDYLHWSDYLRAIVMYIVWQGLYIWKTEILDKDKFDKNPELLTSLRWLSKDTKNAFARAILKFLRKLKVFRADEDYDSTTMKTKGVFVMSQFMITLISLIPSLILYHFQTAHLLYIGFVFTVAVFNGASFYIEVFSVRYHLQLEKLEKMHDIAIQAKSVMKQISELKQSVTDSSKSSKPNTTAFANSEETNQTEDLLAEVADLQGDCSKSMLEISDALEQTSAEALAHLREQYNQFVESDDFQLDQSPSLLAIDDVHNLLDESKVSEFIYNIDDDGDRETSDSGADKDSLRNVADQIEEIDQVETKLDEDLNNATGDEFILSPAVSESVLPPVSAVETVILQETE
jgi:hypothetical protein